MNPKLEKFLNQRRREELEDRNKHLVMVGLTDDTKKIPPIYSKKEFAGSKYDYLSKKYYTDKGAIDVTDEEYAEICKYNPMTGVKNNQLSIQKWV